MKYGLIYFALTLFLCTCGPAPSEPAAPGATITQQDASNPYADRIAAAHDRLNASPAGRLVAESIEAHGGLESWYGQSPLYYHFDYRPQDGKGKVRDSYILNDYVNARAVHQVADNMDVTYGFDGKDAWQNPADAELVVSPRFWSLTPYYFVGLPFVLADDGIIFEQLEPRELDGTTYNPVKVTYESGMGDADDDYYILYINPDTKQLDALNYIVSYPGFFEDGKHLPEKLMRLTDKTTVSGITLPGGYLTSWSDKPNENITTITVSDYEFRLDTDVDAFDRPAEAKVVNDLPASK